MLVFLSSVYLDTWQRDSTLILNRLSNQFGTIETLLTAILDKKPKLLPKKPLIALVICSTICVFGLSTVVQAGVYWEEMLNYYAGFATVVLALINATVYGWIYGAGNLLDHLQHMINIKFPVTLVWILLFLWKILAPLIISVILIFNFIAVSKIDYHGYVLPDWAQLFGWLTVWVPFLMVPIAAVLEYRKEVAANPYEVLTVWQRIVKLTKPSTKWIPSYLKHEQDIINPPTENGVDNADTIINSSTSYGTNRNSIDMTDITLQNSNLPV
ncbi:hypothetical protein EB796_009766 [Bugula neritina]|uniref:Uncharacterized protein n=1 Tax=Bugula neritina TaxID=10212 RepID=A0A7J7K184_BUGNE|nr:hypothetical protein EB796_009766 [Bugula neritina]